MIAIVLPVLAGMGMTHAQAPDIAVRTPFATAVDGQRRVLADLARILQEEKFVISDGAVRADLQMLLNDELRQVEDIRAFGKRLLGRNEDELAEEDRADRNQLADNQDRYAAKYRRVLANIKAKAAAQPDSDFTRLMELAEATPLDERMTEAGAAIRKNQLGTGLRTVDDEVVVALRRMIEAFGGSRPNTDGEAPSEGTPGIALPSLVVLAPDAMVRMFGSTSGQAADALGKIMTALRRLEELVERQRGVAAQAKSLAGREQAAGNLAREELDIRLAALEVGTELAALDPQLERLIRTAAATIEQAMPGMEKGPLLDAVAPAELAAEQLQAAATQLRDIWNDILKRIKEYTEKTEPLVAGSLVGSAHGMSAQQSAAMEQLVFKMLRATGALTEAIRREQSLLDRTQAAEPTADLSPLKAEQAAIAKVVTDEVLPNNVRGGELPAQLLDRMNSTATAKESLRESLDRMRRASIALDGKRKPEAAKRERESRELMEDALQMMVAVLQKLLGQFMPPGMGTSGSSKQGLALDPAKMARSLKSHDFKLPPKELEAFQRAMGSSFPQRYDRAIKDYYEAITREHDENMSK